MIPDAGGLGFGLSGEGRARRYQTRWPRRVQWRRLDLLRDGSGAFWDALCLQSSRWYALRLFGRHWRLAAAAVVSLSVAISATTIGLSAYNALLLRPPAVSSPGTLRFIHEAERAGPMQARLAVATIQPHSTPRVIRRRRVAA